MKKFLILYKMPLAGLDAWAAKPKEETKSVEEALMLKWQSWSKENADSILESNGAGKTKMVNSSGVHDFRNEIMLYSVLQGEDRDSVAKLFIGHPHLEIPEAWIEITEINQMN
jgi:abortive infection bacteriophage resistance protein